MIDFLFSRNFYTVGKLQFAEFAIIQCFRSVYNLCLSSFREDFHVIHYQVLSVYPSIWGGRQPFARLLDYRQFVATVAEVNSLSCIIRASLDEFITCCFREHTNWAIGFCHWLVRRKHGVRSVKATWWSISFATQACSLYSGSSFATLPLHFIMWHRLQTFKTIPLFNVTAIDQYVACSVKD